MDHENLTTDQLRALGRMPGRLPDPRPYSYERACELLAQTIAMLEHRTREHEAAIERVSASAAAVADLLSGLEGSSMEARREAIRICEGIAMVGRPCF